MARKAKSQPATCIVRITPGDLKKLKRWAKGYGTPVTKVLQSVIYSYTAKAYKPHRTP